MGIMNIDSLLESTIVTVSNITADEFYAALCARKSRMVRMNCHLMVQRSEGNLAFCSLLGGAVDLRIISISNCDDFSDPENIPFNDVVFIRADVLTDFQPDHGKSSAGVGVIPFHKGDIVTLACLLSAEKDDPKGYLFQVNDDRSYLDQLTAMALAGQASTSGDGTGQAKSKESGTNSTASGNATAESTPKAASTGVNPKDVLLTEDEIKDLLGDNSSIGQTGDEHNSGDNDASDDGPLLTIGE